MKTGSSNVVTNIIVGIVGAFLGGWLASMLGFASATGGLSIASIITQLLVPVYCCLYWGLFKKAAPAFNGCLQ